MDVTARLHPVGRHGLYNLVHEGKLLVEHSRDPELTLRVLCSPLGIIGKLIMLDGKTGRPRTIINIEKAAKVTVKEGPLRFESVSIPDRAPSPEEPSLGSEVA